MYNTERLPLDQLPTSRQLVRSTAIAIVAAAFLLITVILPAEYAVDPTGIGRLLRLTQMGEIKMQLAADAAADAAKDSRVSRPAPGTAMAATPPAPPSPPVATAATTPPAAKSPAAPPAAPVAAWRDETRFRLAPGEGIEIKLKMDEGARAEFSWAAHGGALNYDTHGDGGGRSISYEKGRSVSAKEGELRAAFTGNHGWFWRNRDKGPVEVILRTRGDYISVLRVK